MLHVLRNKADSQKTLHMCAIDQIDAALDELATLGDTSDVKKRWHLAQHKVVRKIDREKRKKSFI